MGGQPKNGAAHPLNIALIGCGKMGTAMLRGWLKSNIENRVYVVDPQPLPEDLDDFIPNPLASFTAPADLIAAAPKIDIAVLAVKPQVMDEVCRAVSAAIPRSAPVLSIAAGRTIASLEACFGNTQPVIRAMPNTPAALGKGITVATANRQVTPAQRQDAERVMQAMGQVRWVEDEALMDPVTAVSGSGPAYVFLLIEVMAKAGEKQGLSPDLAMILARQTVIGSAALAEQEAETPAETLRRDVTSPGGTTAAALGVLHDSGAMQDLFDRAVAAATARGKELSQKA